jgi:hypothetical protein
MSATIEIKYYNSFWLKKMASITAVSSVNPNSTTPEPNTAPSVGAATIGQST